MARRFGVRTPDVILLPIGGVARLERIPGRAEAGAPDRAGRTRGHAWPSDLLYLILRSPAALAQRWVSSSPTADFLLPHAGVNVWLLLFNLIPAFPMDGGRVLRALLASRLGLVRGTRVAATLGQSSPWSGALRHHGQQRLCSVLIAFFVFLGASCGGEAVETRAAGEGLRVAQMMVTELPHHPGLRHAGRCGRAAADRGAARISGGGQSGPHRRDPHPRQPDPRAQPARGRLGGGRIDDRPAPRLSSRRSASRRRSSASGPAGSRPFRWWMRAGALVGLLTARQHHRPAPGPPGALAGLRHALRR